MSATQIKDAILAFLAAAGAYIANILGGWDAMLKVLVAMMCADYVTGLIVAGVFKRSDKTETGKLSSDAGMRGLVKKCMVLLLVYISVLLDNATGAHYVRSAVLVFFIGNEGLSLLENIGLMGVPYPAFLKNMLQALHDKGDKGNDKTDDEHEEGDEHDGS
jgi:toxin secretion/phage lysis holin